MQFMSASRADGVDELAPGLGVEGLSGDRLELPASVASVGGERGRPHGLSVVVEVTPQLVCASCRDEFSGTADKDHQPECSHETTNERSRND